MTEISLVFPQFILANTNLLPLMGHHHFHPFDAAYLLAQVPSTFEGSVITLCTYHQVQHSTG